MSAEDLFAILNRDFYSALSPAAQIQISNAVDLIERGLYTSGLTAWCTLIVTLYDTVACFSLEKRYMWPGGISLIKVLYFFTRYIYVLAQAYLVSLFHAPWTPSSCRPVLHLVGLIPITVAVPTHILLMIRAWAVCERKMWILLTTIPLICLETAMIVYSSYATDDMVPFVGKTGACLLSGSPLSGVAFHTTTTFLDLYLMAIVIVKTWQMKRIQKGVVASSLINFIFSHSLTSYIVIAVAAAINLFWMGFRMQHSDFTELAMISVTLQALLTLRMILSLKVEAVQEKQNSDTDTFPLRVRSNIVSR